MRCQHDKKMMYGHEGMYEHMHYPKWSSAMKPHDSGIMMEDDCCSVQPTCNPSKECVKTYNCCFKLYKVCKFHLYKVCPRCGHEFDYHYHKGLCPKCG